MPGDLQLRNQTLAHRSTGQTACQVHIQPGPCRFLQLTPTSWVNMGVLTHSRNRGVFILASHRYSTHRSMLRYQKLLSTCQGLLWNLPWLYSPASDDSNFCWYQLSSSHNLPACLKCHHNPKGVPAAAHQSCLLLFHLSSLIGLQRCIFWTVHSSPCHQSTFSWVSGPGKPQCYSKWIYSNKPTWEMYI